MIIKCPQCTTGYNIPDKLLSDKPRKMKCAKCTHTFTVTRKTDSPPQGYVEFTGGQKLPPEFAFLKASTAPAAPKSAVVQHVAQKQAASPPTLPQTDAPQSQSPPASASPQQAAQLAPQFDDIPEQAPQSEAARAAVEELRQGGGTPIGTSLPAETMFGANSSAWEVEAPLELGTYPVSAEEDHPHGNQAVGKIVFAVFVLIVGLFIFVAYRNSWTLSLSELSEQFAFAFSGEATETLPDEVENIEVTVIARKVISARDATYLSVSGEVVNNNPGSRSNVIIRARLYDGKGNIRSDARMPCGRAVDEKALKKTAPGAVMGHFSVDGKLFDCRISPNDSRLFQVVFEEVPQDYDASFEVKVKAVAATAL